MILQEVISFLEDFAPTHYAEDFDNVGLLVGDTNQKVNGILVSLDCLEATIDEAIQKKCNCVVAFHPIIFKGLKKITGKNYVERTLIKAIQNSIAIYAIHTALDNHYQGVNYQMGKQLGLQNMEILIPKQKSIKKLTTYVPKKHAQKVKEALFKAGAGNIGNYSNCSFTVEGNGTFLGSETSNPQYGEKGKLQIEAETQINITFDAHLTLQVISTLIKNHPYEEVAYEVETLENTNQQRGIGMSGYLKKPISEKDFIQLLKNTFGTPVIRHSDYLGKPIHKIAVLGGSGAFAISKAKAVQADAYVTADLKYHDFYQAENKILLADVGHYESEQYTKALLLALLQEKFTNFAIVLSEINTNPIQYS
ncbi:Nif3-like dinuclear metal center hexameric protein [Psychroflexus salis]|uniref:GTP cyclohydrolase 1 type 2 homolog n=1 Tax=Psychroflexus salis TaxID=1526574 RepID=A0A916ZXH1_9FLAO|nr:Nif3-like dinuclear metal center hexameric protein [Psychroflexus salis]GGE17791.1 GTP cyclohydrolase 1 type 2 [Psychroflexus salis]